jgi:hypothetical protein
MATIFRTRKNCCLHASKVIHTYIHFPHNMHCQISTIDTFSHTGWNKRHRTAHTPMHGDVKRAACRVGGLVTLCARLDFRGIVYEDNFHKHTSYVIPGWRVDGEHCVVLLSSINLVINWYRATSEFQEKGGPIFAIDHTYKMDGSQSPHVAVNIVGPHQSVHRIAFGVVSSESAEMTQYVFRCVRQHAEDVVEWYAGNALPV